MRSLGIALGVLLGLGSLGCARGTRGPERIDGRSIAPCPPRETTSRPVSTLAAGVRTAPEGEPRPSN